MQTGYLNENTYNYEHSKICIIGTHEGHNKNE